MSAITVPVNYYQQFDADFSLDVPEEGYGGWKRAEIELSPEHTAVVVMHAWDCGTKELYPGWFRACACIPRTYEVCRTILPGLLAAVRASEFSLFHVAGWGNYYESCPGYQKTLALAGEDPDRPPGVEADPVYRRLQQFRSDNVSVGKHNQADVEKGSAKIRFPREAEPQGDEPIAKDAHQLTALCRHHGVNHLIYAGFNIDWCLLASPGGMVDMVRRGAICSAFRQAVTGVESKETARRQLSKENSLWRVAVGFGFVFDVDDFVRAIS